MSQHGARLVSLPVLATVTMPVITLASGGRALVPWPLPHTQHNGWPVDMAIWPAKCPSCWGCMCSVGQGQPCRRGSWTRLRSLPASSGLGQCGRGAVVSGAVCSQRGWPSALKCSPMGLPRPSQAAPHPPQPSA